MGGGTGIILSAQIVPAGWLVSAWLQVKVREVSCSKSELASSQESISDKRHGSERGFKVGSNSDGANSIGSEISCFQK